MCMSATVILRKLMKTGRVRLVAFTTSKSDNAKKKTSCQEFVEVVETSDSSEFDAAACFKQVEAGAPKKKPPVCIVPDPNLCGISLVLPSCFITIHPLMADLSLSFALKQRVLYVNRSRANV